MIKVKIETQSLQFSTSVMQYHSPLFSEQDNSFLSSYFCAWGSKYFGKGGIFLLAAIQSYLMSFTNTFVFLWLRSTRIKALAI